MGWRMGEEGGKPNFVSPSVRNTVWIKQLKQLIKKSSANKAESSIHPCFNNSPWNVLCGLAGWDGHVHSGSVSAEALLLEEMCRLIPTMDLPPPAINFFFLNFNLHRLSFDQNQDHCANKPTTTVLMGYELVAFYLDLLSLVSYTNIIIWH